MIVLSQLLLTHLAGIVIPERRSQVIIKSTKTSQLVTPWNFTQTDMVLRLWNIYNFQSGILFVIPSVRWSGYWKM